MYFYIVGIFLAVRERERVFIGVFFQNGNIEYCYEFRPPNHDWFNLFNLEVLFDTTCILKGGFAPL